MSKQTAVEFLAEKYNYITWMRNRDEISPAKADKLRSEFLKQAKEMEKEQIMEAHYAPKYGCFSEKYYDETFGDVV